ncbi:MAG: hypothetical protein AVDCRST_MAG66-1837, partial [uncultured Pseudonocardia sp.]
CRNRGARPSTSTGGRSTTSSWRRRRRWSPSGGWPRCGCRTSRSGRASGGRPCTSTSRTSTPSCEPGTNAGSTPTCRRSAPPAPEPPRGTGSGPSSPGTPASAERAATTPAARSSPRSTAGSTWPARTDGSTTSCGKCSSRPWRRAPCARTSRPTSWSASACTPSTRRATPRTRPPGTGSSDWSWPACARRPFA